MWRILLNHRDHYGAANGAVNHLLGVMLDGRARIKTVHVPYRGAADSLTDTIGGLMQFNYASLPSAVQLVRSGRVRAVAVTSGKRAPALPEVPTIAESGFPGFDIAPWFGIFTRSGTPQHLIRKINADINTLLTQKDVTDPFANVGAEPLITTPEQFTRIAKPAVIFDSLDAVAPQRDEKRSPSSTPVGRGQLACTQGVGLAIPRGLPRGHWLIEWGDERCYCT